MVANKQTSRWVSRTVMNNACIILPALMIALFSTEASSQVVENNILQNTLDTYQTRMSQITGNIGNLLINTFVLLATIEFIWGMIKCYLDNGGLQTFLSEIVTRIMFIGFFYYLFLNGTAIPLSIVATFRELAAVVPATDGQLRPDNIIDIGQNFIAQSWDEILSGEILSGLGMLFASLIVFIAMVFLAAHLTVALLEFYVVGYGGFVLLALGGSRWTHGYAVSYLKYAASVGMKLFILLIIVAVIEVEMSVYLQQVAQSSITNVWAVTAFALFSVILAVNAPQSVMGMMSGVSIASGAGAAVAGAAVATTARTAAGVASTGARTLAGAATATAGAGSAAASAASLARAASQSSSGGALGSASAAAGAVAKEVGGAAGRAGANVLSKAFPVQSSAGSRLATRMNQARKDIEGGD